jgi:sister-chromatid-cohesion protein PDS5
MGILQEIFQLIVTIFQGLDDVNSPSFARRVNILETVAKVRSCVVMLDLECDDLILEMFHTFFDTARYYQFPALTILSITITMQLLLIFSLISSETSVLLELNRVSE